jgi:hypothetical protein
MDRMSDRQERWRKRELRLRTSHNINSAVEAAVNEESEGGEDLAPMSPVVLLQCRHHTTLT